MRHCLIATGAGLLLGLVLAAGFFFLDLLPRQASVEAHELDFLFLTYQAIQSIIFGLVVSFMLYAIVVFRRRDPGEHGPPVRGQSRLARVWFVVTLALVLGSAFDAIVVLDKVSSPRVGYAQQELVVKVIGFQWGWRFEYPAQGFESRELVLARDRPTLLKITALDVVHSFYVPEFRMKIDAMPGMETEMRVVPTLVGTYQAPCAELCGLAHSVMAAPVRVVESAEFEQWLAAQGKP